MSKPKTKQTATSAERPRKGGSYTRNPETGRLSRVQSTKPAPEPDAVIPPASSSDQQQEG